MTRAPTPSQFRQGWETVAVSALRQFDLGPGSSLLDVAAGNGDLSILVARAGADVTAVDVSPTMIERLDQRAHSEGLDIEAHVIDGAELDFDDHSFDVVSSLNPIGSLLDAEAHLAEMTRVARHGGQVQMVALAATDKAEFRTFLESGELTEVRITSEQVERDGEFTVVNVGIGVRQ